MNKFDDLNKKIQILKNIQKSDNRIETLREEQEKNSDITEKLFETSSTKDYEQESKKGRF